MAESASSGSYQWLRKSVPLLLFLVINGCLFDEDFRVASDSSALGNSEAGAVGGSSSATAASDAGFPCQSDCASGWAALSAPPIDFVAREHAAVTAFDNKIFIFGGVDAFGAALDTGAIYDPASNTWELVSVDENTPEPRMVASASAVDGKIVVWGGKTHLRATNSYHAYENGAVYDPATRRWSRMPNGWTARAAPFAAVNDSRVVLWGGYDSNLQTLGDGELFNAAKGGWEWMSAASSPGVVKDATVVAADGSLFVYGGLINSFAKTNHAYRYDLALNQWVQLTDGPSARWGSFGAWDGSHVYIWGGHDELGVKNDGRLMARSWIDMDSSQSPKGRWAERWSTGWAFALATDDIAFMGGYDAAMHVQKDGLRYQRATAAWSSIPAWPSGEDHSGAVAVWVDGSFVLFGGRNGNRLTLTGERYRP